jgi:hypothetical protein
VRDAEEDKGESEDKEPLEIAENANEEKRKRRMRRRRESRSLYATQGLQQQLRGLRMKRRISVPFLV